MRKKMFEHLPFVATMVLLCGGILLLITAPGALSGVFEEAPSRSLLGFDNQQHVQLTLYFIKAVAVFGVLAVFYNAFRKQPNSNEIETD